MALQGTLETFSVPEVLRLLSSTRKTGLLALDGDRGHGEVWLGDGSIISARSDHEGTGDIDATLFDLLRFASGNFLFEADATPDHPVSDDVDVEAALGRAEELLAEWRELETVVPSLLVGVRLARALDADSVTVTAEQWRSLAAIGGGTSAAGLGQRLELGELDTCRRIRDLIDASLVELHDDVDPEPVPERATEPESTLDADDAPGIDDEEPTLVDHDLSHDEVASLGTNLAGFVARPESDAESEDEVVAIELARDELDQHEMDEHDETVEPADDAERAEARTADLDDIDTAGPSDPSGSVESPDEFLAQLTNLSPKAAAAIEATAEEATARAGVDDADDDGDDADVESSSDAAHEGDEEINRNLLLKFLSSTKN